MSQGSSRPWAHQGSVDDGGADLVVQASGGGIASISSINSRAGQFIQDPLGFGWWHEDNVQGGRVGTNSFNGTIASRTTGGRFGAGKFGASYASTKGISWQQFHDSLAPLVSNPRFDAWFLSAGGWIDHLPGGAEVGFAALVNTSPSGALPFIGIPADSGSAPYIALMHHPDSPVPENYCLKVWDGTTATFQDFGVPVVTQRYTVTEMACDGSGGTIYLLINGVVVGNPVRDMRFIPAVAANGTFFDRGASDESGPLTRVYDYIYVAGGRT